MFLESFRHLIEIEALKKENLKNQDKISSENKRISDLEERRKKTLALSESLKIEEKNLKLHESQSQIEDLQVKLKKFQSQLSLAVTEKEQLAFENQIKITKEEIGRLETIYFEKLEHSENLLATIRENSEFLAGSILTIEEIKSEVDSSVAKENAVISNRSTRITALLELCHPSLKSQYLDLEKRLAPKSAVAFVIEKKCTACHMLMDSVLRSSLEEGRSLEVCPHCSRLLIPETSKIY